MTKLVNLHVKKKTNEFVSMTKTITFDVKNQ